jgi:zinc protease
MYPRLTALIACLALFWAAHAQPFDLNAPIPIDPKVKIGKLANGLTYYIRQNAKPEKRAELRLVLNAGSILEDEDQKGLAHFVEHMAFNGSKNFSKNQLVNYLQSIGVEFGADLNAYTSFDETVYILPIPTDKAEIVDKGLLILQDWASGLSFDNQEIDKERNVVIEEWRMGQGADQRMMEKYLPVIFKDSRYALRLPIGSKENLEKFKYDVLKRFYKEWYRPDLMAIVIVGDIDPINMEKEIIKRFSSLKNPPKSRKRDSFSVPDHDDLRIVTASDPEASTTQLTFLYKKEAKPIRTLEHYRQSLIEMFYMGMLNRRFTEIGQQANPPFLQAECYFDGTWARSKDAFNLAASVTETGIEQGLQALLQETEVLRKFGFTAGELERFKKDALRQYEMAYLEREKNESEGYTSAYIAHFLQEEPILSMEFEYAFAKEIIPNISLEEINRISEKTLIPQNRVLLITAPQKEGLSFPAENRLREIIENAPKQTLTAYEDGAVNAQLMEKLPQAGKIVSEKKLENIQLTEWTLSNGAKVVIKPTDFKNDEVLFYGFSRGGQSVCSDSDYLSATYASSIVNESGLSNFSAVQLPKMLAGKMASVSPFINDLTEGVMGGSSPQDLETMFQLNYLFFTAPRPDTLAFRNFIQKGKTLVSNMLSDPQYYFYDQKMRLLCQNHPRGNRIPTEDDLKNIDFQSVFRIYKERFADASDFTFFLVGNVDLEKIKPLVELYVASLPSLGKKESWKDLGVRIPKGLIDKTFKKGKDQKSSVSLVFSGAFDYNRANNYAISAMADLLEIKLVEKLREEQGGTYSVEVEANTSKFPVEGYQISIDFACAPENVEKLCQSVWAEIRKMQSEGSKKEEVQKVKETMRLDLEKNLKENGFWLNSLQSYYYHASNPSEIPDCLQFVERINEESIRKAAIQYFDGKNYIRMILMPE